MYVLFLFYSEKKEKKVKLISSEFVDKEELSAPKSKKKSKNKFKGKLVVVRQAKLKNQICAMQVKYTVSSGFCQMNGKIAPYFYPYHQYQVFTLILRFVKRKVSCRPAPWLLSIAFHHTDLKIQFCLPNC